MRWSRNRPFAVTSIQAFTCTVENSFPWCSVTTLSSGRLCTAGDACSPSALRGPAWENEGHEQCKCPAHQRAFQGHKKDICRQGMEEGGVGLWEFVASGRSSGVTIAAARSWDRARGPPVPGPAGASFISFSSSTEKLLPRILKYSVTRARFGVTMQYLYRHKGNRVTGECLF